MLGKILQSVASGASATGAGASSLWNAGKMSEAYRDAGQMQDITAQRNAGDIWNQYQQSSQQLQPYMQAGQQSMNALGNRMQSGYYDPTMSAQGGMQYAQGLPQYQGFGISPMQQYQQASQPLNVNLEQDPGYQYRMQEGTKALEGSAAASGGLFSGQTGKDLATFGQNLASQEYGQAYNRAAQERQNQQNAYGNAFNQNMQNQQQGFGQALQSGQFQNQAYNQALQNEMAQQQQGYNQLYNVAGMGQNSINQNAALGQQAAAQRAAYLQQGIGAQAQGRLGSAGAWADASTNLSNAFTDMNSSAADIWS